MNTAERAARRYYRKVRSWLPGGKMRRYVMTQIRETVQEFVQEHPDADVAAIQAQLGTPQEIAASGMDYIALGHIHQASGLQKARNTYYAWPGCPEGRGFDECGEKGFYLLDTDGGKMRSEFIKAATRTIYKYEVAVDGATTATQVYEKVKAAITAEPKDMVRVELVGERDFDEENLADDIAEYIADKYFFVSVKDRTLRRLRIEDYYGDKSLKGEFIREVLLSDELNEEQKRKVIAYGVKALTGREVD